MKKTKAKKKSKKAPKKLQWPLGILDIGSNSIRMVLFQGPQAPKPFFNSKINCMLGRNLDRTGKLYAPGKDSAYHAICGFYEIAQALGVKSFTPFATEALREASDGKKFVKKIEDALGRKINILTGEQEGRLAAQGVTSGMSIVNGVVCDLGGGSLELALIKKGKFVRALSLPLGALRLLNHTSMLDKYIEMYLQTVPLEYSGVGPLYIIGGSFRNMAAVQAKIQGKNAKGVNGYTLDSRTLTQLKQKTHRLGINSLMATYDMGPDRAETLPHTIALAQQLMQKLRADKMIVSTNGIREGVLADLKRHGRLK